MPHIHPGRIYVIEIRAQLGDNEESDPLQESYETPPDSPSNLTAVASSDTTAKLKWLNPASLVKKYQLEYKSESESKWKIVESEPVTDEREWGKQIRRNENLKELDNLKPGEEYLVRLTGVIRGDGNKTTPSVETSFFTDIDRIRDFDADEIGSDFFNLKWRRPRADVTHYMLYVDSVGEKDYNGKHIKIEATVSPGTEQKYKLRDLKPASRYTLELTPYFETRSCAVENEHPRCSSGQEYFNTNLEKPEKLNVEILTPNYAVITWAPVASATHYAVTVVKENSTHSRSSDIFPSTSGIPSTPICKRFVAQEDDKLCFETRLEHSNKYTFRIQGIIKNLIKIHSFFS